MRTLFLFFFVVIGLSGCAPIPISTSSTQRISLESDAQALRSNIVKQRATLKLATLQSEIDALEAEITALEARLVEVNRKITTTELRPDTPSQAGGGTVHTGPRGGRYTISPSGKKVYKKR